MGGLPARTASYTFARAAKVFLPSNASAVRPNWGWNRSAAEVPPPNTPSVEMVWMPVYTLLRAASFCCMLFTTVPFAPGAATIPG